MSLSADQLRELSGGRSFADVPCLECGPSRRAPSNRVRKTMRVWNSGKFLTYCCARCGSKGWAIDSCSASSERPTIKLVKPEPTARIELARSLWERRRPARGTVVERYLKSRGCWVESD